MNESQQKDMETLLESKVEQFYKQLDVCGYVVVGDKFISMNLRNKLNIDRKDYYVVNYLNAEYFITTIEGAETMLGYVKGINGQVGLRIAREQIKVIINELKKEG